MNRFARSIVFAALALAGGCETRGVFPLLTKRDVLDACAPDSTSTWLRTTTDPVKMTTTEILVIGSLDPSQATDPTLPRCFVRSVIDYDASTTMDAGEYMLGPSGDGVFMSSATYDYRIRRVSLFSRTGATREDNVPAVEIPLRIEASGNRLLVTYDGVQHVYTNLYDVVSAVDSTTQQGAETLYALLNLPLYTSQVRVPGFGSARMTMYANSAATFEGVALGQLTVSVRSLIAPDTNLNYTTFEDMTGILVDGLQETHVNTAGTGPMEGIVTITMRNGPAPSDTYVRATIDYGDIHINDGFPDSGNFIVATTEPVATSHPVSYLFANQVDVRPWLPVTSP